MAIPRPWRVQGLKRFGFRSMAEAVRGRVLGVEFGTEGGFGVQGDRT